ncbi:MAG: LysR substrate-binding domain-containing protein [Candidatus Competibacterales bacterium]|nr:LysR substrate-binding domain-containing protein [Candidatus Competibacterales bacterium]
MKLTWLEDFLALSEAGTFSRAAVLRNITQPAFSRRIQMLEDWLEVDLVDRHSQRLQLTTTAARFEPEIRALVSRIYELKSNMAAAANVRQRIVLTTQHMLTVSYLPRLLPFLRERRAETAFRIRSRNREECVAQFARGEADILLCCEAEGVMLPTLGVELETIELGHEQLIPVTASDPTGRPLNDPREDETFKLLNYPVDSFLGRVVWTHCLPGLMKRFSIETVCEAAFTTAIKEMTLSGMGISWLPRKLIEGELNAGTLVSLRQKLGGARLVVALHRARHQPLPPLEDIWQLLRQEAPRF